VSALAVERLVVRLGGRTVVDGVSLRVDAGSWAALIGPNGAGKTTTLRAIAGLVPYAGTVRIGGADAAVLGRRDRAARVAFVAQTPGTPSDMTVGEFVALGRTPHIPHLGTERAADRTATARALARLDLGALAGRRLGELSGGERQRAVLARALAQEAEVLLLDEPTAALDLARQQQVLELVDDLRRRDGLTVLAAMHDLTAVALYADAVHLLAGGRQAIAGPPADVLRADTLGRHLGASVRVLDHEGELIVVPGRGGR
jgi:iron complex transport system ATP-binding protein